MAPGVTPKKIYVAGGYAAGKSTFARKLATRTGLPLYHMDTFIWGPHWVQTPDGVVEDSVRKVLQTGAWIIEGWVQVDDALKQADLVVHLDPPGWRLVWQGLTRFVAGLFGRRPELPEGCRDTFEFKKLYSLLKNDERDEIVSTLGIVPASKVVRLDSRSAQNSFLESLQ